MEGHDPHKFDDAFPRYFGSLDAFIHYTCNSPVKEVLDKHGIKARGSEFNCADNVEVLEIPYLLYEKYGFSEKNRQKIISLNIEKILRKLKNE